jgi:hypothetical protein
MSIINDTLSTLSCILFLIQSHRPYDYTERLLIGSFGTFYFAVDIIFFTRKKDFIIHHGLATWIIYTSIYDPYSEDVMIKITNLEWSSLLLNLNNYVTGYTRTLVQCMFLIVFFKIRIIEFVPLLYDHTLTYMQWMPLISLYGLNVYWFRLICKKAISIIKGKTKN